MATDDLPPGWTPETLRELRTLAGLTPKRGAVPPLRPDQVRRLNAYCAARAAEAAGGAAAGASAAPTPLPDDADWAAVRARADVDKPLLDALGATPAQLLASGADLPSLVAKKYDAAAIVSDPALCAQLVQKFGKTNTAVAMLTGAEAAVILAGSPCMEALGLSTRSLLRAVATSSTGDAREEAMCVLLQEHERYAQACARHRRAGNPLAPRHYLSGIPVNELCAVGLDAALLTSRLGIRVHDLPAVLGVREWSELAPLGVIVQQ